MKKTLIVLALSAPFLASAQNLLIDGSFESGLSFWTVDSGVAPAYPVAAISYGPGVAFGENVPADNAASNSPDAVGSMAVYFVDDEASQTLSQDFTVATAGLYQLGYSYYAPSNGYANPNEAFFGLGVSAGPVGAGPEATWTAFSETQFLSAGVHSFSFSFSPLGFAAKDVIIDRAFVTAVPEPETYALMLAGLAGLGFIARRRARG